MLIFADIVYCFCHCQSEKGEIMSNDLLKALALKAKNRLIKKEKSDSPFKITIISNNDDVFYAKVKAMLERDMDVVNPIKELMDEGAMHKMSVAQREMYLLQTVEKYNKFKSLVESEKELKVVY